MSVDDEPPPDPFDGLTFDEDWVAGATLREPPARVRAAQAAFERHDLEEEERAARAWRERRRRSRRLRALTLLGVLLFAVAVGLADRRDGDDTTWATAAPGEAAALVLGGTPTARPAASTEPLGQPANPDASGGTYQFSATQGDGSEPVTYDPCRPISIVVNDTAAPDGASAIAEQAIERVAEVTGLALRIEGPTTETPSSTRAAYQPDRYGDRWAPVLLAWSDPGEVPALGGNVAGVGGSIPTQTSTGVWTYASGIVVLDAPDLTRILEERDDGDRIVADIILHELGHLVGLDHVTSTAELMYPEGRPDLHGYQQGDRTGLTELGQGDCVALL